MSHALNQYHYSLDHQALFDTLANDPKLLIIQDLDGVCMGLVKDPKLRQMDVRYIEACKHLSGRFYVLSNGEHIGSCGVNAIVDRAFQQNPGQWAQEQGFYLPGLAAGGVQFQDCFGSISHPGVSDREMEFLQQVPQTMRAFLRRLLSAPPYALASDDLNTLLDVIVLDNAVSPTVNIGSLYSYFKERHDLYRSVQLAVTDLVDQLLLDAQQQNLADAFFVHLAPNLGSVNGRETLKPASDTDMGTTDFQFMLQGAVKDIGVMVLLNHYYFIETGGYPLGPEFNARNAPRDPQELLDLAEQAFDPKIMPRVIAVGDTVTSSSSDNNNQQDISRGGSDRGFLTLVQQLGERFGTDNAVVFVDSSGGELNRPGIHPAPQQGTMQLPISSLRGITDQYDPLMLNFLFPGGHEQYTAFFTRLAYHWRQNHIG